MELTKKGGLEALNARDLAKELGCSVAPIYTAFGSLEHLEKAVKNTFLALIMEYTTKAYSKDTFLNIGIGLVRFAIDYPKAYYSYFLQGLSVETETNNALMEILCCHPLKDWLDTKELQEIMTKMDVFTSGLCLEIVLENPRNLTLAQCEQLLSDVGQEIIIGTLVKKGVYESVKKALMGK